MKNLKLLTALAGLTLASAAQAQAPVKVFIMAGQSNMQGRGWYDDRSDNGIDELGTLQKFIDNDPGGAYDYLQSSPGVYIYTTDGTPQNTNLPLSPDATGNFTRRTK